MMMKSITLKKSQRIEPKFTKEDDMELKKLVKKYGNNNWGAISKKLQQFPPRMCKERYTQLKESNNNKKDKWTTEEEEMLVHYINEFGTRWSILTKFFPKWNSNDLKNRYYRFILPRESKLSQEIALTVKEPSSKQEETKSENIKVEENKEEQNFSFDDLFSNWYESASLFDPFEFEFCF